MSEWPVVAGKHHHPVPHISDELSVLWALGDLGRQLFNPFVFITCFDL